MKILSLKDKIDLLVAADTFHTAKINDDFFEIKLSDGPVGLRMPTDEFKNGKPTYCLPSVVSIANSWNEHVAYNIGQVLATQCINENVDIILAPGINIKRTPLCGRNFEYFSEDPYLAGHLASYYVNGIQNLGIGTSVKHFCCNNREFDRLHQSSEVDYKTIREIYTKSFEMVIKNANPWTIMCSYNPVNGINVSENKFILNDLLRDKLNFQNVLISDWGAVHNRALALKASLDIQFPYDEKGKQDLLKAIENKEITQDDLDKSIERIKKLYDKIKSNKHKRIPLNKNEIENHCLEAIYQGAVLLKNEDNILPLTGQKIAILGGPSENPLYCGGGSAQIYLNHKFTPLHTQLAKIDSQKEFVYSRMYFHASCTISPANLQTMNLMHGYDLASKSDSVVIVVGNSQIIETESYDRNSIKLDEITEEIILKVAERNKNVVVIIEAGSAIDVSNWADKVKAILFLGFAGSYTNIALANLLLGKESPSGRLSETFPKSIFDTPTKTYRGDGYVDNYDEKQFIGYRWYDKNNIEVMYPFGYGLSYCYFNYSNYKLTNNNDEYVLSLTIENTSDIDGYEVIQIYATKPQNEETPKKELIKFKKELIKAHSSKDITIHISRDDLLSFNIDNDCWSLIKGSYDLHIALNANKILKTFSLNIN